MAAKKKPQNEKPPKPAPKADESQNDAGGEGSGSTSETSEASDDEPGEDAPPKDPREDVRKSLGEPDPVGGAVVDTKTGRVEKPAPGTFDPTRRKPQTA